MQHDYFGTAGRSAAPPAGGRAAVPAHPPRAAAAVRPARAALLVVVLLLGLVGAVVVAAAARVEALPVLRAVTQPGSGPPGWQPSWIDDRGEPARWDPCRPIRYVVNPTWMPPHGRADLAEALRRISAVSGLQFVDGGDTDELPRKQRAAYQPDRYGEQWAPLLVAWVPPSRTDLGLGSGVQGLALTTAVPTAAGGAIVTAQVALDADRRLAAGFGPGPTEGEVLLHELAHAIGLGHVDDPTQVMYHRTTNSESEFGAGDRAGLAALGAAAGCRPAPDPRESS